MNKEMDIEKIIKYDGYGRMIFNLTPYEDFNKKIELCDDSILKDCVRHMRNEGFFINCSISKTTISWWFVKSGNRISIEKMYNIFENIYAEIECPKNNTKE